jgi:hypothetical protein
VVTFQGEEQMMDPDKLRSYLDRSKVDQREVLRLRLAFYQRAIWVTGLNLVQADTIRALRDLAVKGVVVLPSY